MAGTLAPAPRRVRAFLSLVMIERVLDAIEVKHDLIAGWTGELGAGR